MSSPKRFAPPYDWPAIDEQIRSVGVAVLERFASPDLVRGLNAESDAYLVGSDDELGLPNTNSTAYNQFLGHRTVRLHGLLEKLPCSGELIGDSALLDWAERALAAVATSPRLSAAEFIQIQPSEPRQSAHRDSDSWPLPIGEHPYIVNAIVALTEFTALNGATWVAPGSWRWALDYSHRSTDFVQAIMHAGDAVLFRGDVVHAAGANESGSARRAISISFCAGWLRSVENSALNLHQETLRKLSPQLAAVLGFSAYDGSARGNGMLGLYENGDPASYLEPR